MCHNFYMIFILLLTLTIASDQKYIRNAQSNVTNANDVEYIIDSQEEQQLDTFTSPQHQIEIKKKSGCCGRFCSFFTNMTNKVAADIMGLTAVSMFVQFIVEIILYLSSTNKYGEGSQINNFNHGAAWALLGSSIAFFILTRHFAKLPPGEKANWNLCHRK